MSDDFFKKEPTSSSLTLEVIGLTKTYDSFLAVDHISLEIKRGQIFGLIGPNGAGKSTTIKMLTTLLPATSGNAFINGHSIINEPQQVRQSIGYVPQLISADGELTAYENLMLSAKLYGISKADRQKRIDESLEFLNLTDVKDKLVNSFSGGMIRKLEIAQALIHQPVVLFLDEPTVGLDPSARKTLWKHIIELNKKTEMTIFMTTHDMDEADELCDTVALMHHGKIVVMDTPKQLKANLGPNITLDDVFIHHTGTSLKETQNYDNTRQARANISNL